ncbi:MAG: hypothetical protein KY468_11585 [Armatimonadetes bacterium]|nr:hypothetical protein [Armatimonadota bacterium]
MDIWELAMGFMDSQILFTAEELGVFDHLDCGPSEIGGVAAATGLPEDSAERLLVALSALGLIQRTPEGRYVNGPEAASQLVRGKPGYIGAMFGHFRQALYPVWGFSKEALLEGRAQWDRAFPDRTAPNEGMYEDPRALRSFMEGMHGITYAPAAEFAQMAPELKEIRSITDIGGASGAFVIALAETHPQLQATVFDLPPVKPITNKFICESGMEDRIRFHAGDFWEDPIPPGSDAYSLGFILHDWNDTGGGIILGKIAEASRPGGWLILSEYLLNDEKTGPLWVARASVNMLVSARGKERSAPEYAEWIGQFGFDLEKIYFTTKGKNVLMFRKR